MDQLPAFQFPKFQFPYLYTSYTGGGKRKKRKTTAGKLFAEGLLLGLLRFSQSSQHKANSSWVVNSFPLCYFNQNLCREGEPFSHGRFSEQTRLLAGLRWVTANRRLRLTEPCPATSSLSRPPCRHPPGRGHPAEQGLSVSAGAGSAARGGARYRRRRPAARRQRTRAFQRLRTGSIHLSATAGDPAGPGRPLQPGRAGMGQADGAPAPPPPGSRYLSRGGAMTPRVVPPRRLLRALSAGLARGTGRAGPRDKPPPRRVAAQRRSDRWRVPRAWPSWWWRVRRGGGRSSPRASKLAVLVASLESGVCTATCLSRFRVSPLLFLPRR